MCEIGEKGEVSVEGTPVGTLKGLTFTPDVGETDGERAALLTAARRTLGPEIQTRLAQLEADNDGAFRLDEDGGLLWREAQVARLAKGETLWAPQISVDANEFLDAAQRDRIGQRLAPWLKAHLKNRLAAFHVLQDPRLSGAAKGLAFQMWEEGGLIPRPDKTVMGSLNETDKALMAELKIQMTRRAIFVRSVFNSKIWPLRRLLWSLFHGVEGDLPALPEAAQSSVSDFAAFKGVQAYLRQFGFLALGPKGTSPVYVRGDGLDRLEGKLYALFKNGTDGVFAMPDDIGQPLGLDGEALRTVLSACSYQVTDAPEGAEAGQSYYRRASQRPGGRPQATQGKPKARKPSKPQQTKSHTDPKPKPELDPNNPFAALAALKG